jgi:hypothetical protein
MRTMEDEQLINIRYQRHRWTIVKLIASKLNFYAENDEIHPCTGSMIIRELLDQWLSEKSVEWFPKLLKEFQKQGIQNKTTNYLAQSIKDYAESAKITKP